jgi:hypothetical protein
VDLGTRTVHFTDNMGHTSLESNEGGHVARRRSIVLGEGPNAASVVLCALLGQVLQGAAAGMLKFSVRHVSST